VSAVDACLGFALAEPRLDRVVVGVDGLKHLRELLTSERTTVVVAAPKDLESEDPYLINPSRWPAL
jgi:hypothetical protein